jgi:hypothetical protein
MNRWVPIPVGVESHSGLPDDRETDLLDWLGDGGGPDLLSSQEIPSTVRYEALRRGRIESDIDRQFHRVGPGTISYCSHDPVLAVLQTSLRETPPDLKLYIRIRVGSSTPSIQWARQAAFTAPWTSPGAA